MITSEQLSVFFQHYVSAFTQQKIDTLGDFYHLPCTLSSPDNLVLINNHQQLVDTLTAACTQLNQADISGLKLLNACYQPINTDLYLVNIGWQFLTEDKAVYTEFCAIYYLAVIDQKLKIININSQELSHSLDLPNTLTLKR
ncbi:MAG: hypothetical protein ACSHW0_16070 [Thalassotalea sp.]